MFAFVAFVANARAEAGSFSAADPWTSLDHLASLCRVSTCKLMEIFLHEFSYAQPSPTYFTSH